VRVYNIVMGRNSVERRLEDHGLYLSEKLGQHFLVDDEVIDLLVSGVSTGARVIEVGSGIGDVTEAISERAGSVVGIEIDKKLWPVLQDIQDRDQKIKFIFKDALRVPFPGLIERGVETQIVANLPFHIVEPFLYKLIDLPIENAILMMGVETARRLQLDIDDLEFGKMALLCQTFFDIRVIGQVPKKSFYPVPGTDAAILEFRPKTREEVAVNSANYVLAQLFRTERGHGLVVKEINQALVNVAEGQVGAPGSLKKEFKRKRRAAVRRELKMMRVVYENTGDVGVFENFGDGRVSVLSQDHALKKIGMIGIPESILMTPFSRLNNQEIRLLVECVDKLL